MAQQSKPKRRKAWKIISIISCALLMVGVVALPTFLILDTAGAVSLTTGVNRQYVMTFKVSGKVYNVITCYRGETIDYSTIVEPKKDGSLHKYFTFAGWDYNNDGYVDILPTKAYQNLTFVAVFREWRK